MSGADGVKTGGEEAAQQSAPSFRVAQSLAAALPLYIAGMGLLTLMDVLIKMVSARHATPQVAFLRYAFGFVVIAGILAVARPGWPSRESIRVNGLRSLLAVAMSISFFYALKTLPLGDAVALSFLSPTFLALFGAWFLGEHVTRWIWLALAVGFLGMVAIVSGQLGNGTYGDGAMLGAAGAFAAAVFYALSAVLLRSRARHDPVITIVFIQNLGPALILAVPAYLYWSPPSPTDLALFAVLGGIGTCGHLLISHAFARAEANRLAPFEYTALVWAGVLGFAFFGEVPTMIALAGTGLIVVSAVIAGRR